MKKILSLLWFAALCAGASSTQAQDVHFSQFFNAPQYLNPATTGSLDADLRFAAHYRNQWGSVTAPFQTFAGSAEGTFAAGLSEDDRMAVGLWLMNDVAGTANFKNQQAMLSYAYYKSLKGEDAYISVGLQAGVAQQSVEFNNLLFGNQYDGTVLQSSLPTGEGSLNAGTKLTPDFGAGVAGSFKIKKKYQTYVGIGINHISEPNVSFGTGGAVLYRKYSAFAGVDIPVTKNIAITPRLIYLLQGKHNELNIGVTAKFKFGDNPYNDNGNAFFVGTTHRLGDAQVVLVGFEYGYFTMGLSYDVNFSKLTQVSRFQGGPEICLVYKADAWTRDRRPNKLYPCPKF